MKFPGWTAKPPALSELDKIVAYLAEKDVGSQPQVTRPSLLTQKKTQS